MPSDHAVISILNSSPEAILIEDAGGEVPLADDAMHTTHTLLDRYGSKVRFIVSNDDRTFSELCHDGMYFSEVRPIQSAEVEHLFSA